MSCRKEEGGIGNKTQVGEDEKEKEKEERLHIHTWWCGGFHGMVHGYGILGWIQRYMVWQGTGVSVHGTRYVLGAAQSSTVAPEMDFLGFSCFWAHQGLRYAWCLVLLCYESCWLQLQTKQQQRQGWAGTRFWVPVRYDTTHYHCKRKTGTWGQGEQLERARREGGGRLEEEECVERD